MASAIPEAYWHVLVCSQNTHNWSMLNAIHALQGNVEQRHTRNTPKHWSSERSSLHVLQMTAQGMHTSRGGTNEIMLITNHPQVHS
jgi:hypothetical protein